MTIDTIRSHTQLAAYFKDLLAEEAGATWLQAPTSELLEALDAAVNALSPAEQAVLARGGDADGWRIIAKLIDQARRSLRDRHP